MVGTDEKRPYAAPANVLSVLQRARSRNLPEVINNDFLGLAGVPEGAYSRVGSALQFLGFTDEDQRATDLLRALSAAPDEKYRELLTGAVRTAYQVDFERIDPAQDSPSKILDALRPYQPRSQTSRMVVFFLALCREAGIPVMEPSRERSAQSAPTKKRSTPKQPRAGSQSAAKEVKAEDLQPSAVPPTGLLFGVTQADIRVLTPEQFATVWNALGTVAWARSQAGGAATDPSAAAAEDDVDLDAEEVSTS